MIFGSAPPLQDTPPQPRPIGSCALRLGPGIFRPRPQSHSPLAELGPGPAPLGPSPRRLRPQGPAGVLCGLSCVPTCGGVLDCSGRAGEQSEWRASLEQAGDVAGSLGSPGQKPCPAAPLLEARGPGGGGRALPP